MPAPISPIRSIPLPGADLPRAGGLSGGPGDFQSALQAAIGGVEKLHHQASRTVESFLAGEGGEVHTVALATQRADLAFETFLQIRNKVVSAYQSVMQMQV
ncbi:MAG TPA: flagellar hook-basal body complex protein FliE [Bryobacteraceae bacterium]|nr:flagellar hook-basal body complex protein FliE [Bryobacteraceae bacterium]